MLIPAHEVGDIARLEVGLLAGTERQPTQQADELLVMLGRGWNPLGNVKRQLLGDIKAAGEQVGALQRC